MLFALEAYPHRSLATLPTASAVSSLLARALPSFSPPSFSVKPCYLFFGREQDNLCKTFHGSCAGACTCRNPLLHVGHILPFSTVVEVVDGREHS